MNDKFKTILELIESETGVSAVLFVLLKMDDITDRWTVLYADSSINSESRKNMFNILLEKMKMVLTAEELSSIARIGIFSIKDHLTECLLRYQSGVILKNEKINGNFIHEGFVIKSDAVLIKTATLDSITGSSIETPKSDPR